MSLPRHPSCAAALVAFSTLSALHLAGATPGPTSPTGSQSAAVRAAAPAVRAAAPAVRAATPAVRAAAPAVGPLGGTSTARNITPLPAPPSAAVVGGQGQAVPVPAPVDGTAATGSAPDLTDGQDGTEQVTASAVQPTLPGGITARETTGTRSAVVTDGAGTLGLSARTPSDEARLYRPVLEDPVDPVQPPAASGTAFGMSIAPQAGESAPAAVRRLTAQFGSMPAARVFSPGLLPAKWSDNSTLTTLGTGSSVIYSFKGDMTQAAAGAYDARIRSFLGSRPAGVKVWLALNHEPEDDIERGAFTAAQFRAATAHVAPVVRAAGGIPTTILMQYSLTAKSRDWHDYYSPAVDVLAWDGYNSSADDKVPGYKPAANFVAPVLAVAKETGKAFGWAELGSPCITSDPTCQGRAAWLTSLTKQFSSAGASFATYWNRPDFGGGFDYSLTDAPSVNAWKTGMQG